ncbi:PAS domain-containing protein [Streptomyces sp. AK02-01A]|uniref:PAS domain-containing protein n=1 Tax=Streptomyces sp. AK02-01A TaxID=3028648 RepID=UPI0039F6F1DE
MDSGIPPGLPRRLAAAGRIPLAVVVVDGDGLVSHWSSGARRLFGHAKHDAVGQLASDLMPVAGALAEDERGVAHGMHDPYDELGPELHARGSCPTAGRAKVSDAGHDRLDVLWWAYPLAGPGPGRHLVLAADTARFRADGESEGADTLRIAPGFALHTEFPDSDALARRLPDILPNMSPAESSRVIEQVLELGCPVLEFSHHDRVPVTPDWGVPRRPAGRHSGPPSREPSRSCSATGAGP